MNTDEKVTFIFPDVLVQSGEKPITAEKPKELDAAAILRKKVTYMHRENEWASPSDNTSNSRPCPQSTLFSTLIQITGAFLCIEHVRMASTLVLCRGNITARVFEVMALFNPQ